ncbi:MAG: hypothetical protein ABSG70_16775 [Terriglobales bacterium]
MKVKRKFNKIGLEISLGLCQTSPAMKVDPKFVILKHMGKTPSMATCARCHIKFFTPLDLLKSPQKAVENLLDQFGRHKCVLNEHQ